MLPRKVRQDYFHPARDCSVSHVAVETGLVKTPLLTVALLLSHLLILGIALTCCEN